MFSPSAPPSDKASYVTATREFLNSKHWPVGLQTFLLNNLNKVAYRYFICDDSGSMASNDGTRILGVGNNSKVVSSTRWMELSEAMVYHSNLAHALGAPCQFRLLNGSAPISIGGGAPPESLHILSGLLNGSPGTSLFLILPC